MKVEQIHEILNDSTKEILGETAVINEDLSNIVDIGNEIFDLDKIDNYVHKLVNRIGKTVFSNKKYEGNVPSVYMDSWEYGSVMQKINAEIPEASENESWKLEHNKEYKTDVFYQPEVSAKFYNSKVTFEINMSFTELQIKESFTSASEMNGFLSMLTTAIDNSMTIKMNNLIMKTINNMTGEVLTDDNGNRAVNLATGFDNVDGLTLETAIQDPDFIRYASHQINVHKDRLTNISTLFNVGSKERFTQKSDLRTVILSDFASASNVYLNSDVRHNELTQLTEHETIPFWQGSGVDYGLGSTSSINVKTSSGATVSQDGIIAIMFDKESLGVTNTDNRVTTNYNPKAEFYTNYYKFDASYFNDLDENFIVFYIDFTEPTE